MHKITMALLDWYHENARELPFRGTRDPYLVWVSEIMLQQTRTETVKNYYTRFIARFPDVYALASADEQDVLKMWEGLGYYSRARHLHACAKAVCGQYNGVFPKTPEELKALPGIGDYTAAAIASIAYDVPVPAVDGNLTRVLSRVFGVREDVNIPGVKRKIYDLGLSVMPAHGAGNMNQALMDLGAGICVPGTPDCARCPLQKMCDAFGAGDADLLPVLPKKKPPTPVDVAVLLVYQNGKIFVTRRTQALLQGLYVFYLVENAPPRAQLEKKINLSLTVRGTAKHVFTHRVWNMTIYSADYQEGLRLPEGEFINIDDISKYPFPTAMRAACAMVKKKPLYTKE